MMINSGNGHIYVTSIKEQDNRKIEDIMKINLDQYEYISDLNANLFIDKTSPRYCKECYYIIAIQGNPLLNG
jgi:hypothetical protein